MLIPIGIFVLAAATYALAMLYTGKTAGQQGAMAAR